MNLRLFLFLAAGMLFYGSERFTGLSNSTFLTSVALWSMGLLLDVRELRFASSGAKTYLRSLIAYRSAMLLGVVCYLLSQTFSEASARIHFVFLFVGLVLIGVGGFWGLTLELLPVRGFSPQSRDEVRLKSRSSLSLAFLLVTLVSINFIAHKTNRSFDSSYLKVSQAGEASQRTVERLTTPVRVGLFFSRNSEVLPMVREYFARLPQSRLTIEIYDKDFNPTQAEEFRVARNGQIVLLQNEKRQRFEVGDKFDEARRNLRTLDASFLKALLQLTSLPSTLYFTSTHGEMLWETGPPARSMAVLEEMLRGLNFRSRRLTTLFQEVPPDTKVLGIIAPVTGFTAAEINALDVYLQKGGRVLLALDFKNNPDSLPASRHDELLKYLARLGVSYNPSLVVHDQKYVAAARDITDRAFIFSNVFGNHPAVGTVNLSPERMTFMTHRSGSFDLSNQGEWQTLALVKSLAGSFRDKNANFTADAEEKRGSVPLVVSAESKSKGRLVVFADATSLSNPLMKVSANQLVAIDSFRWLSDRTEEAGAIATEEDVLIQQEKSRENIVFYASIFAVPLLVLGAGVIGTRKRRSRDGRVL